ncbi:MAG: acyltransferase family protein [Alphaproteobacteria bacterium]|nr:acyltransferase family protein [Alphaproteobacteria bacterium]
MLNRLQALRAVAAYMVVLFHCFEGLHAEELGIPRMTVGAAGVGLFFVISGFIMVYVAGSRETPPTFIVNRIARIVPLYWAATFAALTLAAIRPWLLPGVSFDLHSILASLAFVPHRDALGELKPILFLGWTLNWEMLFYLLFAISMLAAARFRLLVLSALMTAVFVVGLLAPQNSPLTFYAQPILYDFIYGCLIATGMRSPVVGPMLKRLPAWTLILVGATALLATVLLPESADTGFPVSNWTRPLLWGIPAALVVLGVVTLDLSLPPAKIPTLKALGDASYSAYLLHPLVFAVTGPGLGLLLGATYAEAALFLIVAVAGTMLASLLSYRFFEIPSRNLVRDLYHRAIGNRPTARTP